MEGLLDAKTIQTEFVIKELDRQSQWEAIPSEWEKFLQTPMAFADVRLFFGDQRSGKSITAVACMIDDYYKYLTHVVSPEGEIMKARALNLQEQGYLESIGIRYNNLTHVRIFNDDENKSKIVTIPENFSVISPVKVFANRDLWGIRYIPFDLVSFFSYINTPLMIGGWFILSESVLINRKDTMSNVGKFMEWFGAECGKRHLHMIVDMQYRMMLQKIFHLYATTVVECEYDQDTMMVSLDVNKSSPVMNSISYWSYPYRRFFDTDELMGIPQYRIDRAVQTVVG